MAPATATAPAGSKMDRVSSNTSCAGQGQGASVPAVQPSQWPQRTWSHQTYPVWGRGKGQAPVAPGWNPPRQSPRGWCGGVMRHGKSRREGGMQQKLGRKKRREETRGWVGREQQQEYGSMAVAGGRAGKCCPRNSSGPQHISATPSPPHLDRRGDGGVGPHPPIHPPHPTLIAEEMAVLSTSTQPSSSSRQSRKVSAPTNLTATPSAKLSTLLRATRRPWASDCVIALAPAAGARSLPSSSPGRSGRLLTAGCVFVLTGVTQRQAGQHAEAQEGAPEGASVGARSGVG